MPAVPSRHNPFEFGGELKASALIDREQELDLVIRTIENGGKLFLIGPRRYGKTSILAACTGRISERRQGFRNKCYRSSRPRRRQELKPSEHSSAGERQAADAV
jgi:hypothetical protein